MAADNPDRGRDLDFYFDFISPYAYLAFDASRHIAERHGRRIIRRPFRLGVAVVKVMGLRPLMQTPLKADYVRRDIQRLAAVLGLPIATDRVPQATAPPALIFYASPAEIREDLARALLHACWAEGKDIGSANVLGEVARTFGLSGKAIDAALEDPRARATLSAATHGAIERGVFGSPTVAVGSELFWGVDRLGLLDNYLASGETYREWGTASSKGTTSSALGTTGSVRGKRE